MVSTEVGDLAVICVGGLFAVCVRPAVNGVGPVLRLTSYATMGVAMTDFMTALHGYLGVCWSPHVLQIQTGGPDTQT